MLTSTTDPARWRGIGACATLSGLVCTLTIAVGLDASSGIFSRRIEMDLRNSAGVPLTVSAGFAICDHVEVGALALSPMAVNYEENVRVERRHLWVISSIDWWISDGPGPGASRVSRDRLLRGEIPEVGLYLRSDRAIHTFARWDNAGPVNQLMISRPIITVVAPALIEPTDDFRELKAVFHFRTSVVRALSAIAAFAVIWLSLTLGLAAVYRHTLRNRSIKRLLRTTGKPVQPPI